MKPVRSAFVLAPVIAATAALASAQRVIPVQDLLYEELGRDRYLELPREQPRPARCFAGENLLGGLVPADESWYHDRGGRGHFTRDQLGVILSHLGFDAEVRFVGRSLVVPTGAAEGCRALLDELRDALPPRMRIDIRLTQEQNGETVTRLARTVEVDPGRLHVVSTANVRNAIVDYQVELAQGATIANPQIQSVRGGAMVALRPQMPPSGEWAVLEVITRCIDHGAEPPIETGYAGLGAIDRVALGISETGRVVRVRPGSQTVQRWSGPHGTFELTLACQWQLPKPVRPGGRDFAVFTMRGASPGFRSMATTEQDNGWRQGDDVWDDMAQLAASDATWIAAPDDETDAQKYIATGTSIFAAGAAIAGWFESLTAGPQIDLRCFDVAAGASWPADGSIPADAVPIGHARFSQVDGTWSATAMRTEQSYLRDWDCEVAQSARVPDPKVARLSTGLVVNLRRLGEQFEIEGEWSRLEDLGATTRILSQPVFSPGASTTNKTGTNDQPAVGLVADSVRIERPHVAIVPLNASLRLVRDEAAIWRTSAADLLGAGRELVMVVTVE